MHTDHGHKTVLVAGATGRLGVVVEMLLARGHAVRAMTRQPDSPAAELLRAIGAEVVSGDYDDAPSIERAATGIDALFATGTAHKTGPAGELRHGRNVADAAAAAGVAHLIYSSGDGAREDSPLPLFRAKFGVEQHIRSLAIPHTILAPVYFMENLFNPWNLSALAAGVFPSPIPVDMPLQQVAIADVAAFAASVIERPEQFVGERITIASDELTAVDAARSLTRVVGRDFDAEQVSPDHLPPGVSALFGWLERVGHDVDMDALHQRAPDVGWHTYETWADSQRPRFQELCPREHASAG